MTAPANRPPRRPYPGLRPFRRDESDLFFGRDDQVDQLLDKLAETRFLAVIGTSGSGKSSLVRAGLLPALDSGVLTRSIAEGPAPGTRWSIAELRPGEHPFQRLAAALQGSAGFQPAMTPDDNTPAAADPTDTLEQALRRGPRALPWLLGLHPLPPGERLLILVDQFEELFRYRRADPADAPPSSPCCWAPLPTRTASSSSPCARSTWATAPASRGCRRRSTPGSSSPRA